MLQSVVDRGMASHPRRVQTVASGGAGGRLWQLRTCPVALPIRPTAKGGALSRAEPARRAAGRKRCRLVVAGGTRAVGPADERVAKVLVGSQLPIVGGPPTVADIPQIPPRPCEAPAMSSRHASRDFAVEGVRALSSGVEAMRGISGVMATVTWTSSLTRRTSGRPSGGKLVRPDDARAFQGYAGWAAGWWSDAACRGSSPDTFFPEPGPSRFRARQQAILICSRCRVFVDCFHAAMSDPTLVGIWAATDEQDRQRARTRQRHSGRAARPEPA